MEKRRSTNNEFGTVVVQITVNRSGNVIAAKLTKGTTNTNPCLGKSSFTAKKRKYKWQSDPDALKQIVSLC
jgi:hypothetical protein